MLKDTINLDLQSSNAFEIPGESKKDFNIKIKKLTIFEKLDTNNFNEIFFEQLNESIKSCISFLIDCQQIKPMFNDQRIVGEFKSLLVNCPLDIVCHLNKNDLENDESLEQLYSLAMIIKSKSLLSDYLTSYKIKVKIQNKLKNKIFNHQPQQIQVTNF